MPRPAMDVIASVEWGRTTAHELQALLFGHRRTLLIGVALLAVALVGLIWRNVRREREMGPEAVETYVSLPGRPARPSRVRHGGEVD